MNKGNKTVTQDSKIYHCQPTSSLWVMSMGYS